MKTKTPTKTKLNHIKKAKTVIKAKTVVKTPPTPIETSNDQQQTRQQQNTSNSNNIINSNPTPINSKSNYLSNAHEFFFTFVKDKKPTFNSEYDKAIYNYPLCHGKERLDHPTQKPLKLCEWLINTFSDKGDRILDPFAGSGTTILAAKNLCRDSLGIEKNTEYCEIARKRLANN